MKLSGFLKLVINPFNLNINPLNLNFRDKALEREFTEDYKIKNVTLAIIFTLLSTLLFSSFYLVYNMSHPGWFVAMIVLSAFFGITLHFGLVRKFQVLALFMYSIIIEGSYTQRMLFYDGSDKGALAEYFMGLMLIVLSVNLFLRMKFVYAAMLNTMFFLIFTFYSTLGIGIHRIAPEYFGYSSIVFLSTIIVLCIAIYNNEYIHRNAFVQEKTIRRQANKLQQAKEDTERTVVERTRELEQEKQKSYIAILEGQQIERQRIAQDLHDSLNIRLIGVKRKLEMETNTENDGLIVEVDGIIAQVREISHNLLPYSLKHFGLVKAIDDLCVDLQKQQTFGVTFLKIGVSEELRWDSVIETEIYKVIQELAANIIKHARATQIIIELICAEKMIYLTVEDNGEGFNVNEKQENRFGLNNIEARLAVLGGTMSIDSQQGKGTTVMINIPISTLVIT